MNQQTQTNWKRIASVWVPGSPQAQPRTKAMTIDGMTRMYTPDPKRKDGSKPVGTWRQMVQCYAAGRGPREPLDCAIKVDIAFFMPRTKALLKNSSPLDPIPHTVKPDKDNLEKLILDELTKLGWWVDDSRVCAGLTTKHYHARDMKPGAMISVSVTEDEQQLFRKESA